jgi:hypothetical protein
MLAVADGELLAGPGGSPAPATVPIVAYVVWHAGRVLYSSTDGDPRVTAWQYAAAEWVSPSCPLRTLTAAQLAQLTP